MRGLRSTPVRRSLIALGTVLVACIGMLWFKEPASAIKVFSLALIVTGLFLLNLKTA